MTNNSVLLPCAVLGCICAVMFIFICWWFPRQWTKGLAQDRADIDEELAHRRQDAAMAILNQHRDSDGRNEGVGVPEGGADDAKTAAQVDVKALGHVYRPPPVAVY